MLNFLNLTKNFIKDIVDMSMLFSQQTKGGSCPFELR